MKNKKSKKYITLTCEARRPLWMPMACIFAVAIFCAAFLCPLLHEICQGLAAAIFGGTLDEITVIPSIYADYIISAGKPLCWEVVAISGILLPLLVTLLPFTPTPASVSAQLAVRLVCSVYAVIELVGVGMEMNGVRATRISDFAKAIEVAGSSASGMLTVVIILVLVAVGLTIFAMLDAKKVIQQIMEQGSR